MTDRDCLLFQVYMDMPGKYHDWQELLLFQVYGYAREIP